MKNGRRHYEVLSLVRQNSRVLFCVDSFLMVSDIPWHAFSGYAYRSIKFDQADRHFDFFG
jgi:hypothetical protein